MGQNKKSLFYMGGSGLDRSDDFHKFCESGLDWIQFYRIRTGLGLKNLSVRSSLENMKNYYKTNIKTCQSKIANLGIIHRAIKSAGRLYTISLLVNYTVKAELRSFCCSMLHPNNACRKHLILFFIRERKNLQYEGTGYLQKICRSCKKTDKLRAPCCK